MQLILEGMGRALHTNLNARFKCDALKVMVSGLKPLLQSNELIWHFSSFGFWLSILDLMLL